jgi:hypothetical protein
MLAGDFSTIISDLLDFDVAFPYLLEVSVRLEDVFVQSQSEWTRSGDWRQSSIQCSFSAPKPHSGAAIEAPWTGRYMACDHKQKNPCSLPFDGDK